MSQSSKVIDSKEGVHGTHSLEPVEVRSTGQPGDVRVVGAACGTELQSRSRGRRCCLQAGGGRTEPNLGQLVSERCWVGWGTLPSTAALVTRTIAGKTFA